jgi:hypothetical protein
MQKIPVYALIGVAAISSIASVLSLNLYLIIFSVSATIFLFFLYKLWDVFEAIVIKRTGVVQIVGDYELEADRFSAIRKKGLHFSAVSAAILRDFPSKEISRENIERIISSSNSPFRFVVQVEKLNTGKITDDLKTKRRMKELELSKSKAKKGADSGKVLEREIELIESEIKSINSGAVPLKTSIYVTSVGSSESRFAAQEKALSQIKEIAGEFSAVLGAGFEVISGTELISIIKSDLLD